MRKIFVVIILLFIPSGIVFPQKIEVTSPGKGNVFQLGQSIDIRWRSSGVAGNVGVVLVKSDQSQRHVINLNVPSQKGGISYKIPTSVPVGYYYIAVGSAETAGISSSFNVTRSTSSTTRSTFKTEAAPVKSKPDLIIEKIEISDRTPPTNKILDRDELHFLITVKNIGTAGCENDFYLGLSTWGCDTNTWKWQESHIGRIPNGHSVLKIIEVKGASHISGWKDNPHVCIKVDTKNQIQELRESNNTKSITITAE